MYFIGWSVHVVMNSSSNCSTNEFSEFEIAVWRRVSGCAASYNLVTLLQNGFSAKLNNVEPG